MIKQNYIGSNRNHYLLETKEEFKNWCIGQTISEIQVWGPYVEIDLTNGNDISIEINQDYANEIYVSEPK